MMELIINFANDFLSSTEILIGLIVCLGLVLQGKSLSEIVTGTVKTIIGILILFAGADVVCGALDYLTPLIKSAFHAEGLLPNADIFVALAMVKYPSPTIAYIIVGSMLVNIIIARFTSLKYIFLTGHHILVQAVLLTIIFAAYGITGWPAVILGSLFAGLTFSVLPAIDQRFMNKITDGQPMAIGHFGATGYWLAGFLGKYVGSPEDSTESIEVPKSLQFIKETVVASTLVMICLFTITYLMAEPGILKTQLDVEKNPIIFILTQSLVFGAGLTIIIQGVRMMVAEILPAFEGIANKIVPNAIPALDCPVVFPFAPNAVIIGFISATVAGVITTIIIKVFVGVVVVPPVVEFFFMGGAGGVFGNATGGKRGCILGGAVNGILFTVLPPLVWQHTKLIVTEAVTVTDPDFCWSGIIVGQILKWLGFSG